MLSNHTAINYFQTNNYHFVHKDNNIRRNQAEEKTIILALRKKAIKT